MFPVSLRRNSTYRMEDNYIDKKAVSNALYIGNIPTDFELTCLSTV